MKNEGYSRAENTFQRRRREEAELAAFEQIPEQLREKVRFWNEVAEGSGVDGDAIAAVRTVFIQVPNLTAYKTRNGPSFKYDLTSSVASVLRAKDPHGFSLGIEEQNLATMHHIPEETRARVSLFLQLREEIDALDYSIFP